MVAPSRSVVISKTVLATRVLLNGMSASSTLPAASVAVGTGRSSAGVTVNRGPPAHVLSVVPLAHSVHSSAVGFHLYILGVLPRAVRAGCATGIAPAVYSRL